MVDHDNKRGKSGRETRWLKHYCAGIILLDLENSSKVIGIYDKTLVVPKLPYETDNVFRTNVFSRRNDSRT